MASDGKVTLDTSLDNKGLIKGIQNIKGMFGGLNGVVRKLGTVIAAVFGAKQIISFMADSSKAAMSLSDALTGLRSILEGQGRSFSKAQSFIEAYTSDGLIPATNAITAYKNLASRGYDDSQIQQVLLALKDASAYGRQASYTIGEAVESATEGLKNENSILVDNAGVTKNVAKMWEEYAASIGTTANNLTQQQKIQAEVTGILEETKFQTGDAATVAGTLSGQLQQLSFNFNNLKVAVGSALNPIVQSFLPIINTAISTLVRFANAVAAVIGLIFGKASVSAGNLAESNDAVASSASAGAAAEKDLADATTAAGKAAKKSLAGFDELNRLQGDAGGGASSGATGAVGGGAGGISVEADVAVEDTVSPKFQAIADKIQSLLAPLREIDFGPAIDAFGRLGEAAGRLGETIGKGLEWAWHNVLVPLAEWFTEKSFPASVDLFSAALNLLNSVLEAFLPLAEWLWDTFLQPVAEWTGGIIVDVLKLMAEGLTSISDWISEHQKLVEAFIVIVGSFAVAWGLVSAALVVWNGVVAIWSNLGVIATAVTSAFGAAVGFLTSPVTLTIAAIGALIAIIVLLVKNWDTVREVAANVWEGVKTAWGSAADWIKSRILDPISNGFKGMVNGVIGFINGMIQAVANGINSIVRAVNKLSFSVPSWIPGIGGERIGFNLATVSYPQIPYLAQGAVLPANKPFLAMVGDQKHGTNVEAPLSTIQEAVAIVMEDMVGGMMAGFEALLEENRLLREVVEEKEFGDEAIYKSGVRYQQKLALAKGR